MRLPRPRFTIRWLMVVVAISAAVLWIFRVSDAWIATYIVASIVGQILGIVYSPFRRDREDCWRESRPGRRRP